MTTGGNWKYFLNKRTFAEVVERITRNIYVDASVISALNCKGLIIIVIVILLLTNVYGLITPFKASY